MNKAVQFSNTFRYIDDLFSVNNEHFGHYINAIYPKELELKDTTLTSNEVCYLDTRIKTGGSNTPFHLSVYDKRDDFSFRIVDFPYNDSNILPTRPTVFTHLNWWDMAEFAHGRWILCIDVVDFQHVSFTRKGFKSTLLSKSLSKFFKRHDAIIEKYGITLREIKLTIQDWETRRILCYFLSFVSSYRPCLASIFNMVHARAQFSSSFARALLI